MENYKFYECHQLADSDLFAFASFVSHLNSHQKSMSSRIVSVFLFHSNSAHILHFLKSNSDLFLLFIPLNFRSFWLKNCKGFERILLNCPLEFRSFFQLIPQLGHLPKNCPVLLEVSRSDATVQMTTI